MTAEPDQVETRVAALRLLDVGGPPAIADLRRRVARRRRQRAWASVAAVSVLAAGLAVTSQLGTTRNEKVAATGPGVFPAWTPQPGVRLVTVSGTPAMVTVVDPAANTSTALIAPANPSVARFELTLRGGRLVFAGDANASRSSGYGPGYATFSIDLNNPAAPLLLGTDGYFVPSASPDRVWIVSHPVLPTQTVREMTAGGAVTVADLALPNVFVQGATSNGLVITSSAGLQVWSPTLRRVVRSIPGDTLLAADGDFVASCTAPCPTVTVTDARSGHAFLVSPPAGSAAFATSGHLLRVAGAFSPDHRKLALFALRRAEGTEGPASVAVIDTGSGKITSSREEVFGPEALAWGTDSKWLFFVYADPASTFLVGATRPGGRLSRVVLPPLTNPLPQAFAVEGG